jgi:hypothetical protein
MLVANWLEERKSGLKSLPGPFSLPFLGCLHLLAAKRIPFAAFTDMIQVKKKAAQWGLPGPFFVPFLGCLHLLAAKRIPFTDMIQV